MAIAIKECLDSTRTASASTNGITLCRMANHRPLITGDVLNIRFRPEDVEKTRLMIEYQWLALRMVAFCAAAEVVDELDPESPHIEELSTFSEILLIRISLKGCNNMEPPGQVSGASFTVKKEGCLNLCLGGFFKESC
ncbi:unnamed protein product [Clonostachys byssicola]|uniref:Uncharacterized protein n=1 Tax=Clonostachys byssicola TaxID=160290 RepID=A0A9N9UIK2_9HYPO|nr:unnamed protein product [Clonostachys byssicola]